MSLSPTTAPGDAAATEYVSDWIHVTQDRINAFADATDDHQFIHINPEAAAKTQFGGTIAHGFLTLSLLSALIATAGVPPVPGAKMGVNYGLNRVRFLSPVPSGKRVRGRFRRLSQIEKRPGQFEQVYEVTVEIEGAEKPAMIAEWINQSFV